MGVLYYKGEWNMQTLYKGIFWIKNIENVNAVVVKSRCNHNGEFIELLKPEFLSKSGLEFNHKAVWNALPKPDTENKQYNYFPRGRVQIRNGSAVIYANANIANDRIKEWAVKEFNLLKSNGIADVKIKADMSKHYLCYLDWI
jgi:hypothetical protein